MSFRATLWAWKMTGISSTQKLVLLDLCDRANAENQCWPRQKTIAQRVCLTERAICTALAAIEQEGLIHRLPRFKAAKRTSDLITVLVATDTSDAKNTSVLPPKSPQSNAAKRPPTENGSGDRMNVVQADTRRTFSEISNVELPRLNIVRASELFELMPQPDRPDIDGHNATVALVEQLKAQFQTDFDWAAPGIDNCRLPAEWLCRHGAAAVGTIIVSTVTRRRQTRPADMIVSWAFFASEIARLETEGSPADDNGYRTIAQS